MADSKKSDKGRRWIEESEKSDMPNEGKKRERAARNAEISEREEKLYALIGQLSEIFSKAERGALEDSDKISAEQIMKESELLTKGFESDLSAPLLTLDNIYHRMLNKPETNIEAVEVPPTETGADDAKKTLESLIAESGAEIDAGAKAVAELAPAEKTIDPADEAVLDKNTESVAALQADTKQQIFSTASRFMKAAEAGGTPKAEIITETPKMETPAVETPIPAAETAEPKAATEIIAGDEVYYKGKKYKALEVDDKGDVKIKISVTNPKNPAESEEKEVKISKDFIRPIPQKRPKPRLSAQARRKLESGVDKDLLANLYEAMDAGPEGSATPKATATEARAEAKEDNVLIELIDEISTKLENNAFKEGNELLARQFTDIIDDKKSSAEKISDLRELIMKIDESITANAVSATPENAPATAPTAVPESASQSPTETTSLATEAIREQAQDDGDEKTDALFEELMNRVGEPPENAPSETEATVEITEALSEMTPAEKQDAKIGLANVGFYIKEKKSGFFAALFEKISGEKGKTVQDRGTWNRFLSSLSKTYRNDEKQTRNKIEEIDGIKKAGGKTDLIRHKLANIASPIGTALKLGRTVSDLTGFSLASPFRYAMMASMGFARGAQAAKETRLSGREVLEKVRFGESEEEYGKAYDEAMKVYELAEKKVAEGQNEVTSENLSAAYLELLPRDLKERLKKESREPASFAQKLVSWDAGRLVEKINAQVDKINADEKLSDQDKQAAQERLIKAYASRLKDLDRMVAQNGTVDALAMGAQYLETGAKATVAALTVETAILAADRLLQSLPSFFEHSHRAETLIDAATSKPATEAVIPAAAIETPPAPAENPLDKVIEDINSVHGKDSHHLWGLIDKKVSTGLEDLKMEEVASSKGKMNYLIDAIKDKIAADPAKYGFRAGANIDRITADDLERVSQNAEFNRLILENLKPGSALEKAADLSDKAVANIESHTAFANEAVSHIPKGVSLGQHEYDLMAQYQGRGLSPEEAAKLIAYEHLRPAGTGAITEAGIPAGTEAALRTSPAYTENFQDLYNKNIWHQVIRGFENKDNGQVGKSLEAMFRRMGLTESYGESGLPKFKVQNMSYAGNKISFEIPAPTADRVGNMRFVFDAGKNELLAAASDNSERIRNVTNLDTAIKAAFNNLANKLKLV